MRRYVVTSLSLKRTGSSVPRQKEAADIIVCAAGKRWLGDILHVVNVNGSSSTKLTLQGFEKIIANYSTYSLE